MKTVITILSFIYSVIAYGQSCICDNDSLLRDIISCTPVRFDNKATLSWNFNCDSSWLTFKSPRGQKQVIFSLGDGLQNLTGRLGFIYIREYKNTFLIQNNVISGCCSPPEFFLYDKWTGTLRKSLGRIIFYSKDRSLPIIISVTNSNYNTSLAAQRYTSLTIYNVDKNKTYLLHLPKDEIESALQETETIYPEYLFKEHKVKNEIVTLIYSKSNLKTLTKIPTRKLTVDLKKYK